MLFRKKIERACAHCAYSAKLDEEKILCSKSADIHPADGKCFKFRYDPTKRIPLKAKAMDFSKYDKEDYSL